MSTRTKIIRRVTERVCSECKKPIVKCNEVAIQTDERQILNVWFECPCGHIRKSAS